jgi:hypothetical protein
MMKKKIERKGNTTYGGNEKFAKHFCHIKGRENLPDLDVRGKGVLVLN